MIENILWIHVIIFSLWAWLKLFTSLQGKYNFNFALVRRTLPVVVLISLACLVALKELDHYRLTRPLGKPMINLQYEAKPGLQVGSQKKIALALPSEMGSHKAISLVDLSHVLTLLSLLGLGFCFVKIVRSQRYLDKIEKRSFTYKGCQGIKILISEEVSQPIAYSSWISSTIIIPNYLVEHSHHFRNSILHELQHIRARDPFFTLATTVLGSLFWFNPFTKLLSNELETCSEFACDQALVGRKGFDFKAYASCLLYCGEQQLAFQPQCWDEKLVGTTGLSSSAKPLMRRITTMTKFKTFNKKLLSLGLGLGVALTSVSAIAARNLVSDSTISETQLRTLTENSRQRAHFPVFMNKEVLRWLNLAIGTERGKRYTKASFKRMKQYEPMIREKLSAAQLPADLLVVPIHESGYQSYDNGIASGIWSFTPGTARRYGLTVNDDIDERLDPDKLTDAAVSYYSHLIGIERFEQKWELALLAYNSGERRLLNAIDEVGTTEIETILEESTNLKPENRRYLDRFMAFYLIWLNPELLD